MSTWILAISLGPVGGFIAAGRRSRDLWWGSTWVSQAVREVADALDGGEAGARNTGVTVVLPTRTARAQRATRYGGRVSNKIVVKIVGDADACQRLAAQAHARAQGWLVTQVTVGVDTARRGAPALLNEAQVSSQLRALARGDFLEFRAGWAPLGDRPWNEALREATTRRDASPRLFNAPGFDDVGVHKCDLDPGRPSALRRAAGPDKASMDALRGSLGVREGEELDALYLARRLARFYDQTDERGARDQESCDLGRLPFPPVGRVAIEPWLAGALRVRPAWIRRLRELHEQAARSEGFAAWCSRVSPDYGERDEDGAAFPFDPAALFEGGGEALRSELGATGAPPELQELERLVKRLHGERGAPEQYYALIEADGDGVGWALAQLDEAEWARAIDALDAFSRGAAEAVAARQGVAFYAAGDEIMLYAPADRALEIVDALQGCWIEATSGVAGLAQTSLSAGVALVHVKDDLDASRGLAHGALRRAKDGRPAGSGPGYLCLIEAPRAGAPRALVGSAPELAGSLQRWCEDAMRDGDDALSLNTEQILRAYARRLDIPDQGASAGLRLAQGAVLAQLGRSERRSDGEVRVELARRVRDLNDGASLRALADELRIAATLAKIAVQRRKRKEVTDGDR